MRLSQTLSITLGLFISLQVCGQTSTQTEAATRATSQASVDTLLTAKLQELFSRVCNNDEFSGTMLVAKNNHVLTQAACGEASKRYHVANTIDTKFNVASIGKMFTAVGIGQLVEAGRLSYDDTVDKYLDTSWLRSDTAKKITIGQLLSHTSGLGDIFSNKFFNSSYINLATLQQLEGYQAFTQDVIPEFEPGTNYLYSNMGMLLLGVVIEKVSGQNYYDYIHQHVYQPAGMNSSGSYIRDEGVDNLATGYFNKPGMPANSKENSLYIPLRGAPYGAGYSTAHDLLRFTQALQTGKLLKADTLQLFWQDHTKGRADKQAYGYGFELSSGIAGKIVGHSGQMIGIYSKLDIYLDKGFPVVVLSNYAPGILPLAGRIAAVIEALPSTSQ